MKTSRSLSIGAIVLALALVATPAAVLRGPAAAGRNAAPEVAYALLDGRQGTLQALRGKVVLVSFWSMNCDTCVNETLSMVATDGMYRSRGYATLAVAMSYDPPASVARLAAYNKLPFPATLDNAGKIATSYGEVRQTPTAFPVDKRGRLVERYVGAPDSAVLHSLIESLLAERA
jgi:peroxiredoxin